MPTRRGNPSRVPLEHPRQGRIATDMVGDNHSEVTAIRLEVHHDVLAQFRVVCSDRPVGGGVGGKLGVSQLRTSLRLAERATEALEAVLAVRALSVERRIPRFPHQLRRAFRAGENSVDLKRPRRERRATALLKARGSHGGGEGGVRTGSERLLGSGSSSSGGRSGSSVLLRGGSGSLLLRGGGGSSLLLLMGGGGGGGLLLGLLLSSGGGGGLLLGGSDDESLAIPLGRLGRERFASNGVFLEK